MIEIHKCFNLRELHCITNSDQWPMRENFLGPASRTLARNRRPELEKRELLKEINGINKVETDEPDSSIQIEVKQDYQENGDSRYGLSCFAVNFISWTPPHLVHLRRGNFPREN